MKRCSSCKRWLDETEFNRNRSKPDGLQSRCRECQWTVQTWYSLDAPIPTLEDDLCLHDVIAARLRTDDESYERVYYALERWVIQRFITQHQADYLMLCAVDRMSFNEAARMLRKTGPTVRKSYRMALNKLSKRYIEVKCYECEFGTVN